MTAKLTKIALSGDDFDAFSKALDNPSEPNEALKSLFAGRIADLLERCGERIGGGEPNTFTDEIYDAVDRLRAISAARNTVDRDASQVRDSSLESSDVVARVGRAISDALCLEDDTFEAAAQAALAACRYAELVEAHSSACTLLGAHAALYRKEGEESAQILEREASAYRRHPSKISGAS